jgi:hypothetical protein
VDTLRRGDNSCDFGGAARPSGMGELLGYGAERVGVA